MIGKYWKILNKKKRNIRIFGFSRGVLRPGRHPRGFPELVGSILYEYQPERSHMDLFRIRFHDFPPNLALSSLHNLYLRYIETVYLRYKDHTVSVCHYPNSGNPYHPSTATGLPMKEGNGPLGPPWAHHGPPWGPKGPEGVPRGPMGPHGASQTPLRWLASQKTGNSHQKSQFWGNRPSC